MAVFLDPFHVMEPTTAVGYSASQFSSTASYDSDSSELRPRAWWFPSEDKTVYLGHVDAIHYVRDFLAKAEVPFHVSTNESCTLQSILRFADFLDNGGLGI